MRLLNVRGYFNGLLSFIDQSIEERFVRREYRSMVIVADSPESLLERFDQYLPPDIPQCIEVPET